MIVEFGAFALILALVLSLAQTGLSAAGRVRRSVLLAGAGEGAALASFGVLAFSFAALVYAFVVSDFSVANVAANSHSEKPVLYRVAAAGAAMKARCCSGTSRSRASGPCWRAAAAIFPET